MLYRIKEESLNESLVTQKNPNRLMEDISKSWNQGKYDVVLENLMKLQSVLINKEFSIHSGNIQEFFKILTTIIKEGEDLIDLQMYSWAIFKTHFSMNKREHMDEKLNELVASTALNYAQKESAAKLLLELYPLDHWVSKIKNYSNYGVTEKKNEKTVLDPSYKRFEILLSMITVLQFIGDLDDESFIKIINVCLNRFTTPNLLKTTIQSLSISATNKKAAGKNNKPSRDPFKFYELLRNILVLADADYLEQSCGYCFTLIIQFLTDKESPDEHINVDNIAEILLSSYLVPRSNDISDWKIGLNGLKYLWQSSRSLAHDYVLNYNLMSFLLDVLSEEYTEAKKLRILAIQNISQSIEFADLRQYFIQLGGVQKLEDIFHVNQKDRLILAAVIAKLSIQGKEMQDEIFEKIDFLTMMKEILMDVTERDFGFKKDDLLSMENLLQVIIFLCFQENFKQRLLKSENTVIIRRLVKLAKKLITLENSSNLIYLISSTLYVLARSNEDKETRPDENNAFDLDEDQIKELEILYKKLPKEAKPIENGEIDFGTESLAGDLRKIMIEEKCVSVLGEIVFSKSGPSKRTMMAISKILSLFCKCKDNRSRMMQQGAIKTLLKLADTLEDKREQTHARQALAQICISVIPSLLTYVESMDLIPHLIKLLRDGKEIHQYEAALALTNLTSLNDNVRLRVWLGGGWQEFGNLFFSENDLLRAAALEAWCNMSYCEEVVNYLIQISKSSIEVKDIQLLLAFTLEFNNRRAQIGALGSLAILAENDDLRVVIARQSNSQNILKLVEKSNDTDLLLRGLSCLLCLVNGENVPNEYIQEISNLLSKKVNFPSNRLQRIRDDIINQIRISPKK